MAKEKKPYEIIAEMYETYRRLSDREVLAELTAIPPLVDEDDSRWATDDYWIKVAYPYVALWDVAAERRLREAIPMILDRACYGDPGEIMRDLCHALEGIVNPNWSELTGPCVNALKSPRAGTRLWAVRELMRLRDPAALAPLKAVVDDEVGTVRDYIRKAIELTFNETQRPRT